MKWKDITLKNIRAYIIGNIRYKLYYSRYKNLIPEYIREQINWRINVQMDKECFMNGSCKLCGCMTTHLQMANKSCDKPCYPKMLRKKSWEDFKKTKILLMMDGSFWGMKRPDVFDKARLYKYDHKQRAYIHSN